MPKYFIDDVRSSSGKLKIADYLIFVEGKDDAWFFECLMDHMRIDPTKASVNYAGGKDRLASYIGLALRSHDYTSKRVLGYAIVRDADGDKDVAEKAIEEILQELGEACPSAGSVGQTVDGRRLGFYLFPGNGKIGDLETLLLGVAAHPMKAASIATHYSDIVAKHGELDHSSKRMVQAYLAVASSPLCSGAGRGMQVGAFDRSAPALNDIARFIRDLII
ncbi:DUF3226 domain-containing protein [Inquilinus limosus]|uniref:DUF3226 domain-containing protein n=1 Tax=Inquilinus limosus TaxID=171674 RepID=UPI0012DE6142|nr:DUF3226 domain-containing protein [Inquilinus limosus]